MAGRYREPCLCGALDCRYCYPCSWKENLAELLEENEEEEERDEPEEDEDLVRYRKEGRER